MDKAERIKMLVEQLNKASKAYYQDADEIMSNYKYDQLYDELLALEEETGMVLSNSPTVRVGYEVLSGLPKETRWLDGCLNVSSGKTCKGGYPWKRSGRRGDYFQCQGVPKYSAVNPISGRFDFTGRGNYQIF